MSSALILSLMMLTTTTTDGASPETVAKQIEAFYKDRADIRAEFVQRVKKPGRSRTMKKSGKVFFKRPGKMRWDYKKPEQVFYISDGKVLWSYQPEDALVTKLNITASELYHQSRYLFGQGDLSGDFELAKGTGAADGQYALVLKPKKSSRNFKHLTLVVDLSTGEIKKTILVDPYDNTSTIEFKRMEYKVLADKHFNFSPPASATVRDLSKRASKK